jgi:hypothetical protein
MLVDSWRAVAGARRSLSAAPENVTKPPSGAGSEPAGRGQEGGSAVGGPHRLRRRIGLHAHAHRPASPAAPPPWSGSPGLGQPRRASWQTCEEAVSPAAGTAPRVPTRLGTGTQPRRGRVAPDEAPPRERLPRGSLRPRHEPHPRARGSAVLPLAVVELHLALGPHALTCPDIAFLGQRSRSLFTRLLTFAGARAAHQPYQAAAIDSAARPHGPGIRVGRATT